MLKTRTKKQAWNKDKTVGQWRPFTPREVQVIRYAIEREQNGHDLHASSEADQVERGV